MREIKTISIKCETKDTLELAELTERYCDVIRRRYTKWCLANNRPLTSGCLE